MYQLKDKVGNIKELSIVFGKVSYVKNGIFIVENNNFDIHPMLYSCDITNNNIWIKDNSWENYLMKVSDKSIKKLDFNIGLNGYISNIIVVFKDNTLSCFSTVKNEIVVNFPIIEKIKNYLSNDTNIFFQVDTTLKSLSLLTGEYEWEVDLSQNGEITTILGVVEDELYVWLGSTTLVAINIQNGLVQWHINTYETHQVGFDTGVHLLADERKVVLFHETNYVEIDLQTQNSKLLLKNTFGQDCWVFATSTVLGNYIYFTGRNYTTDELSVGVFNRERLEVEWYYAAPEWQGTVPDNFQGNAVVLSSAPQISDNKLYVLENGTGTLYIFERENDAV